LPPTLNTATSIGAMSRDAGDELDHVFFLARVGTEAVRFAAFGPDPLEQRRELVLGAARDAGDEAFARKPAGDGTAGGIAGTDYKDGAFIGHERTSEG
jgi:hypothetical protein